MSAGENIQASDGGLWLRDSYWWLRSPYVGNTIYFWNVNNYGNVIYYYASTGYGLALGFSI